MTAAKKDGSAAPALRTAKATSSDNIVAVFREVQASGSAGAKGEFESTAQYQARLASWKGRTKKYVFVVDKDEGGTFDGFYTFEYDADAGEMHLTVGGDYVAVDTIRLRSLRTVLGTYVGANAFGARTTVTRAVQNDYYVSLSSFSPFKLFGEDEYGRYSKPGKFTSGGAHLQQLGGSESAGAGVVR